MLNSLADNYRRLMRRESNFRLPAVTLAVIAALIGAACGSDAASSTTPAAPTEAPAAADSIAELPDEMLTEAQRFPDVIDATATVSSTGWTFAVTISSPYDSPERYADGWRILGPDGTEYGFRLLTHDHAAEQPFTRTLDGVEIPAGVTTVTVEGRDQQFGFGGATFELTLPTT